MRKSTPMQCKICGFETTATGIAGHIKQRHGMTPNQYAELYGEYRPAKLNQQLYDQSNQHGEFQCLICHSPFRSNKRLMHHVLAEHGLQNLDYIKQYIFQNEPQLCPCGCQQEVNYKTQPPYRAKNISGHNSKFHNGRTGAIVSQETRKRQSMAAIKRGHAAPKKSTDIEIAFERWLQQQGIDYVTQVATKYGIIDFYLPELNLYVETDGDYWHPKNLNNLNFRQLASVTNDIRKNRNIENLIRILGSDIAAGNIHLSQCQHESELVLGNYDVFLDKQFLINYKQLKGETKLQNNINTILKFIRTVSPSFPYDDVDDEAIRDACRKLSLEPTVLSGNIFHNNRCAHAGTRELKSLFRSFYRSRNLQSPSPEAVWSDDDMMKRLIKYRIGLNASGEVFNMSLNQMRRAITVNKYTVSWFKPHLAMCIYKEFIKDITAPTVLDPCAGFGARMLGFYSAYPSGCYIGIEPNPETFNELVKLNAILGKSSILINDRFENVNTSAMQYDVAFTSIPYWNLEIYSSDHTRYYSNYQDWLNQFLRKIQTTPRMIVNVPESLRNEFGAVEREYVLQHNTSHFNAIATAKQEHILCL